MTKSTLVTLATAAFIFTIEVAIYDVVVAVSTRLFASIKQPTIKQYFLGTLELYQSRIRYYLQSFLHHY